MSETIDSDNISNNTDKPTEPVKTSVDSEIQKILEAMEKNATDAADTAAAAKSISNDPRLTSWTILRGPHHF